MKRNLWKNKFYISLLLFLLIFSCTYYNTFYNARKSFKEGEKAQKDAAPERRLSVGKNHYENAIKKASKVLTFHPKSKWADDALFMIGRAYFNMGEYTKAKRKFEELLASFPKSNLREGSRFYISKCYYYSGEEGEALILLKDLIDSKKMDKKKKAEVSFSVGEIHYQRKEYDDAITHYEKTLNQFDPDTLSAIAQFRIGECLWLKKDYNSAKEAFSRVRDRDPSQDLLYDSRFKEGECYYLLENYEKGMEMFMDLSEDEWFLTKLPSIKLKIAEGYYSSDELCLSMQQYYDITQNHPRTEESAEAYFQIGQIYQEIFGDLGKAKEMYESSNKDSPRSEIAKEALAQSANISKIEEYKKKLSAEEEEESGEALFMLGELYLTQMNQPDSALTEYLTLVDQFPQSEYAAKSLYAAAWILENKKKDTAGATRMYQRILDEYPRSDFQKLALEFLDVPPDSFNSLNAEELYQKVERILFKQKNVDSALVLYDLIIEKFPNSLYASKSAYAKAWTLEYFANPGDSTVALAYQMVIDEFPESKLAEEARIKLGLAKRVQPTLPPPSTDATSQEGEEQDTTTIAVSDTSGPQIPKAPPPLEKGEFVYPETEILSGIRGAVVLKIRIDFNGLVTDAEVVNSLENMWIDEAAREAALNTTFDPEEIDMTLLGNWFLYTVEVVPPE